MHLQDVRKLLRTLVDVPVQVLRTKVKSVDTDNWTAEVITETGGDERYDVQLRVLANGDGFGVITVPKDDSLVLIGIVENNPNACYLVQCSEVVMVRIEMDDKILIEIPEDGKVKIKAEEILFDGSKSGLIDLNGLKGQLNAIEQDLNDLKIVLSGWTPAPNDGGAALKSGAATWYGQQLTLTSDSDIETQKITWQ